MQVGTNPIAFAAKSFKREHREICFVVFECERFHAYVYRTPFMVEPDHNPLEMNILTNHDDAPQRLQRMLLHIHPDDLHIYYIPGKDMVPADTLSHQPCRHNDHRFEHDLISLIFTHKPIKNTRAFVPMSGTKSENVASGPRINMVHDNIAVAL